MIAHWGAPRWLLRSAGRAGGGPGTNNARVALLLRQLSQYYQKDANNLFVVRLAQGLLHMSKGTVSIAPYHSNRQLMSPVAVASLLTVLVSFLDVKNSNVDCGGVARTRRNATAR